MKWKIIDWIIRSLIAVAFLMASLGKLTSHPGVLEMFANFGFPNGFHLLIGLLELAGAVRRFSCMTHTGPGRMDAAAPGRCRGRLHPCTTA